MDVASILGIGAAFIHACTFYLYFRDVFRGVSTFYLSTRLIMALMGIINGSSYLGMTGDLAVSGPPLVGMMGNLLLLVPAFRHGKSSDLKWWDYVVIAFAGASILTWTIYQSAGWANTVLQAGILVSFYPVFKGVNEGRREKLLPWGLWVGVNLLHLFVAAVSAEDRKAVLAPFMYLAINCTVIILRLRYLYNRKS